MPSTPFDQFEFDDQPEYATPSRPPATPANTAKRVIVTIIWLIATVLIILATGSHLGRGLRLREIQLKYHKSDIEYQVLASKHLDDNELKAVQRDGTSIVVLQAIGFGMAFTAIVFVAMVLTVVANIFMSDGKRRYRRAW
jgi:hypothetical protein